MLSVGHLDDDVLERYSMNRLSETESETVEDHIAVCSVCLDRLDQTTAFVQGMKSALQGGEFQAAPKPGRNWFQRWMTPPVWAGAALAAAGLLFVVNQQGTLSTPAPVTVDGTRGTSTVVHGTGPFDFELFMPAEAAKYHVELLDANGAKRWESDVPGDHGKLHAVVKEHLSTGPYFLHVQEPVSGSQHDYAVQVVK